MGFGQILFLLGMMAVVGPILIHLLIRPRFKRLAYTMIDFLEVSQKQSHRTRRLREWLILLLRCTIVALLACMFALPFIALRGQTVERPDHHFLVVDNSLSMTYQDQGRSLLDRAIETAVQYVGDHQTSNALFDVYAGSGDLLRSKLGAVDAIKALKKITPTARKTDMTDISAAVGLVMEENERAFVHMVSDFTPVVMDALAQCSPAAGFPEISYDIVGAHEPANALVKEARVLRYRNGVVELIVEVENSGQVAQKRLLSASVASEDLHMTSERVAVALPPAGSSEYVLKLHLGDQIVGQEFLPVEIALSPSDNLTADDTYFLGVQIESSPQQRVFLVGRSAEQSFLIREALKAISRADFDDNLIVRINQGPTLDRTLLDNSDILICGDIGPDFGDNSEPLDHFLVRGGTAVFFVSADMSLASAQRLCRAGIIGAEPIELIDERHALSEPWPAEGLFADAGLDEDTARALRQYALDRMPLWSHFACRPRPESTSLWPIETGHYLVYVLAKGAGKSLLINTSIDDTMSALTKRAVVIPLCQLILGRGSAAYGYGFHAEEQVTLPLLAFEQDPTRADQNIWVLDPSGTRAPVAVTGSSLTGRFAKQTGWLQTLSDPVRYAGVNVATNETDLRALQSAEIDQRLSALSANKGQTDSAHLAVTGLDSSRPLWRWLAWIVIGLVLAEGLIANRIER